MRSAFAVVGPSRPLVDRAISLGANPTTSRVILNGIDKSIFHPQDRAAARRELGLDPASRQVLFIGRPEPAKGCDELLTAMARVKSPDERPLELVIVGDGPHTAGYRQRAAELGLKVAFMGVRPHASMPSFLAACDLLVLPSWAEGTPNVLIEALACGRRVVATDVGGIPYVVNKPELGVLVRPKDSAALAAALESALATPYDPAQVAASMGFGDWSESAAELEAVLSAAVRAKRNPSPDSAQQSERPVGSAPW
jgi:glycosyltransferase involved in cell wall biosynthesis